MDKGRSAPHSPTSVNSGCPLYDQFSIPTLGDHINKLNENFKSRIGKATIFKPFLDQRHLTIHNLQSLTIHNPVNIKPPNSSLPKVESSQSGPAGTSYRRSSSRNAGGQARAGRGMMSGVTDRPDNSAGSYRTFSCSTLSSLTMLLCFTAKSIWSVRFVPVHWPLIGCCFHRSELLSLSHRAVIITFPLRPGVNREL